VEAQALLKYYDNDRDGHICYEEFLGGLKEPLNERRKALVQKVFQRLDRDGSGVITVADVEQTFNVSQNADFLQGKKSKEQIVEDFLTGFEGAKGNRDGKIAWEEFENYYADLSLSIPEDCGFCKMLESVWCIDEDAESEVSKQHVRHLLGLLRQRLQTLSKHGVSDEYVLRKIFNESDSNHSGNLTMDELLNMLTKFGIACERKYIGALFGLFDTNRNGIMEFEEFVQTVIHSPYK